MRRPRKTINQINVVPYIDVMLVLLIIFMVTAPMLTQGVKVELPQAAAEAIDPADLGERPPIVLSIDREGRLFLNQGATPEAALADDLLEARDLVGIGVAELLLESRHDFFLVLGK
jgi:biopolymer transport protein TolR